MRHSQLQTALAISYAIRKPLMIWGPPGIGKTFAVNLFAERKFRSISGDNWEKHLVICRLGEWESVDFRGTPREKNGWTYWAPPIELPWEGNDNFPDEGILFLDELPQGKMDVKNLATRLVDTGMIGGRRIKKGWRIIAAGNRLGDACGTSPMPHHLNNRFWHVELEVSVKEWIDDFALPNGIDDRIIAYLLYTAPREEDAVQRQDANATQAQIFVQSGALFEFNPKSKDAAFPTPRAWTTGVDRMLKELNGEELKMDAVQFGEYVSGHVGNGRGREFAGFVRTVSTLVTIDQIILDPDNAPLATEPSVCYVLSASLAAQVTRKTIGAAFTYLARLSREFPFVFANKLKRIQPKLQETKAFTDWAIANNFAI